MKNNKGLTPIIILVVILVLIAVVGAFYLGTKKGNIVYSPTPNPISYSPSPSSSSDPTTNWKTLVDHQYSFTISFPQNYQALTDKENLYGWPNAIVLIYSGGQSYDLPIEVWNSETEYKTHYSYLNSPSSLHIFKTSGDKFISLTNINKDPKVSEIISTFKISQ